MTAGNRARAIVVDVASSELRRQLGPTAWAVFEEMLLASDEAAGDRRARVSVRGLASSLGLAKDTVARSIRRLRDAGLLSASQSRDDRGVFEVGAYAINVPDCISFVATSPLPSRPARARVERRDSSQLSLAIES